MPLFKFVYCYCIIVIIIPKKQLLLKLKAKNSTDDSSLLLFCNVIEVANINFYLFDAGLGPQDVDVIELHDCFSANELITYEALGLCPEGMSQLVT